MYMHTFIFFVELAFLSYGMILYEICLSLLYLDGRVADSDR